MTSVRGIQIYGDSILKGVELDRDQQKYILPKENNLEKLGEAYSLLVQNHSKFGCTVEKGFRLLRRHFETQKKPSPGEIVLLEYGGNDSDYDWAKISENPDGQYHPHTELPVFRQVLRRMVELIREHGRLPVIMNLPPVKSLSYLNWVSRPGTGVKKENLLKWLHDPHVIYRHQELYSAAASEVAWQSGAPLLDVRSGFLMDRDCDRLIGQDGIHPSAQGHRMIRDRLLSFARQLGNIPPLRLEGAV